jgi:HTH domain of spoOJ/parA/parB/repB family protein
MTELFAVADENKLMPPKSTWFEPKLRSGIFIHEI